MAMKFTDLSQLTKAVLKKDVPQKPAKAAPKRVAILHPQKTAPVVEPEAAAPKLSREEAECLAYFSRTSLLDPRYAIAGRAKTPPPPKCNAPSTQEESAAIAALKAKEAQLTSEVAALKEALGVAETRVAEADARAAAAKQESEAYKAELRTLRAQAAETPIARNSTHPLIWRIDAFNRRS